MKADQANNIDFPDLLSRLGHQPVSTQKGGNELWYKSPFRTEKEPSFHISKGRKYAWVWKDFGDEGGTVIDFVMRLHGHRSLKKALDYLTTIYPNPKSAKILSMPKRAGESQEEPTLFSFHGQEAELPNFSEDRSLEFLRAHEICSNVILNYLMKQRAIPRNLIEKYLVEVHYLNKNVGQDGQEFYGFGMKNRSDGYEIRAASDKSKFKSALKARDISFIKGSQPERRVVNVFEGMTDFLSLLALYNCDHLAGDSIILHSASSYDRAAAIIKGMQNSYLEINTFLDNDATGQKYTAQFISDFGKLVKDQRSLFEHYKDLNEALVANKATKSLSR